MVASTSDERRAAVGKPEIYSTNRLLLRRDCSLARLLDAPNRTAPPVELRHTDDSRAIGKAFEWRRFVGARQLVFCLSGRSVSGAVVVVVVVVV